jgi:glycosyltransferase involved in cell wall biosynthesis
VAVESGAITEIIENRVNGFLSTTDPGEIVDLINRLFENSAVREAVKRSALESSSLRAQKRDMVPAHGSIYRKLIEGMS